MAPQFVRQGARVLRPEEPEMLSAAAEAFDRVADCFRQMSALFPPESPSLAHAEQGADLLQKAYAEERLGLSYIQRVLRALGVVPDQ